MKKIGKVFVFIIFTSLCILLGGYLFSDTQPRPVIKLSSCNDNCLSDKEFKSLVASMVFQRMPEVLPGRVMETEKSIVVLHPEPVDRFHYIIIPKRDIKNIAEVSDADTAYIVDAYAVAAQLLRENNITKYRMWASGPDYQAVSYLHFHVTGS